MGEDRGEQRAHLPGVDPLLAGGCWKWTLNPRSFSTSMRRSASRIERLRASSQRWSSARLSDCAEVGLLGRVRLQPPPVVVECDLPVVSDTLGPFCITVTFSERVIGFELKDLVVGSGSASELQGSNASYTATITTAVSGAVTVDIAAGAAQDGTRQPERGGGAVLNRRGPDAGAGSAGDRRDHACAAVAGRRRSPADGELTRPGPGATNALPEGGRRAVPPQARLRLWVRPDSGAAHDDTGTAAAWRKAGQGQPISRRKSQCASSSLAGR